MTRRGRPLRFLARVFAVWTGVRLGFLWLDVEPPREAGEVPRPMAAGQPVAAAEPVFSRPALPPEIERAAVHGVAPPHHGAIAMLAPAGTPAAHPIIAAQATPGTAAPPASAGMLPPAPFRVRDRWSASLWLAARGSEGLAPGSGVGQLGGGQAGGRIVFLLDGRRRVALAGRLTTPLRGHGREAAIALEWQPLRAPVRLAVEQRFALDNGSGGPGAGLIAGIDALHVPGGFRLEAYGQAGGVVRARLEPYADGAARITRRIAGVDVGLGAWGAAQRDAARLDIGPTLSLRLPIAHRDVRMLVDWRQRFAGKARPGSGLAVTLGADF